MAAGVSASVRAEKSSVPSLMRTVLTAREISASFGSRRDRIEVLRRVTVEAGEAELVAVIGPSGCGKSTLLRIIAGLKRPDEGRILVDGADVTGEIGGAGYMAQKDLLMPWKSVLDNVAIALELHGMSRRQAREIALSHFPRFGLSGFEKKHPAALSGGMRQRAALLRTFLAGHDLLLLDEPFGSLDALTRTHMQEWLSGIRDSLGKTSVLVTHDVDEAIYLADRIYVMSPRPGYVVEVVEVPQLSKTGYEEMTSSAQARALRKRLLNLLRDTEHHDA